MDQLTRRRFGLLGTLALAGLAGCGETGEEEDDEEGEEGEQEGDQEEGGYSRNDGRENHQTAPGRTR